LTADHAKVFEQKNSALTDKPVIKFYDEKQLSSTLKAKHAQLNMKTFDIEAWGDVIIISGQKESQLETTRVFYVSEEKKMFSNEPVRLIQKDSITTGDGMESNVGMTSIIIKNQKVEILKAGNR